MDKPIRQLTAKEYLSQAYRIDQRINSKIEQVQSLRELAGKATAAISDAPPNGTRNFHRMEDVICKMMDLESDVNADLMQLIDTKSVKVLASSQIDLIQPAPSADALGAVTAANQALREALPKVVQFCIEHTPKDLGS